MARVYGRLGSTKVIIAGLKRLGIHSIKCLSDVEWHLKKGDDALKSKREAERKIVLQEIEGLKMQHSSLVEERNRQQELRRNLLSKELGELQYKLSQPILRNKNPIKWFLSRYEYKRSSSRARVLEEHFDEEVNKPLRKLKAKIDEYQQRIDYLSNNIETVIANRLAPSIHEKERIDAALRGMSTWISGARGEHEVMKRLSNLPDSFLVFNDVKLKLSPPIMSEEGPRFHCQADHVVIGPPGIFNIETKNWSPESIRNPDLRSPVSQISVTGKALFREVHRAIRDHRIRMMKHHWGERKVPVRNVLAMVGALPSMKFQYVKIIKPAQLNSYIQYFEPSLSQVEVESIGKWLLNVAKPF